MLAAISGDIDTLESIYKGHGCRRPSGYTHAEFEMGLENFARFLENYDIKATLFMVGRDFEREQNHAVIKAMVEAGHEIANHTHTHAQGFRLLPPEEKEAEIARMEECCQQVTGRRPVGFRAPGWNVGDDAAAILKRRGYLYDSSVFPTSLMPLLKFIHRRAMTRRSPSDRTTMGHLRYMLAPSTPYRTSERALGRRGRNGIVEIPITVTPMLRLPFFATFLLAGGLGLFKLSYRWLKATGRPIQFQMHLSDFVDYRHPALADQVPRPSNGQYVPQSLLLSLERKLDLWQRAFNIIGKDHSFTTMAEWARRVKEDQE